MLLCYIVFSKTDSHLYPVVYNSVPAHIYSLVWILTSFPIVQLVFSASPLTSPDFISKVLLQSSNLWNIGTGVWKGHNWLSWSWSPFWPSNPLDLTSDDPRSYTSGFITSVLFPTPDSIFELTPLDSISPAQYGSSIFRFTPYSYALGRNTRTNSEPISPTSICPYSTTPVHHAQPTTSHSHKSAATISEQFVPTSHLTHFASRHSSCCFASHWT